MQAGRAMWAQVATLAEYAARTRCGGRPRPDRAVDPGAGAVLGASDRALRASRGTGRRTGSVLAVDWYGLLFFARLPMRAVLVQADQMHP